MVLDYCSKCRMAFMILVLFAVTVGGAGAADVKIGYINSQKILLSCKEWTDVQTQLDKEVAEWDKKAEGMKQELQQLVQELNSQNLMLSEAKRKEKQDILDKKDAEYQQYVTGIYGAGGEGEKRMQELSKPIKEKILSIITRIAEDEEYDFILDEIGMGIIFAKPTFDLTDRILEDLNKETE